MSDFRTASATGPAAPTELASGAASQGVAAQAEARRLLRVLFAAPAPVSEGTLPDLRRAWSDLGAHVKASRLPVALTLLDPPTRDALRAVLTACSTRGMPPDVLHFAGYGQGGYLAFEDRLGQLDQMWRGDIANTLRNRGVRLALLHACQDAQHETSSLARFLVDVRVVEAAISHERPVDRASVGAFAANLYTALCRGDALSDAFGEAQRSALRPEDAKATKLFGSERLRISGVEGRPSEPVLARSRMRFGAAARLGVEPEAFFGRSRELVEVARLIDEEGPRAIVLAGPGGIGKTALAVELARRHAWRCGGRVLMVSAPRVGRGPVTAEALLREAAAQLVAADPSGAASLAAFVQGAEGGGAAHTVRELEHKLVERLSAARSLLVFDALDGLPEAEQERLVHFLERLPASGTKAVLTMREPHAALEVPDAVRVVRLSVGLSPRAASAYFVQSAGGAAPGKAGAARRGVSEDRVARVVEVALGVPALLDLAAGMTAAGGAAELDAALSGNAGAAAGSAGIDARFGALLGASLQLLDADGRWVLALASHLEEPGGFTEEALVAVGAQVLAGAEDTAQFRGAAARRVKSGLAACRASRLLDVDAEAGVARLHPTLRAWRSRLAALDPQATPPKVAPAEGAAPAPVVPEAPPEKAEEPARELPAATAAQAAATKAEAAPAPTEVVVTKAEAAPGSVGGPPTISRPIPVPTESQTARQVEAGWDLVATPRPAVSVVVPPQLSGASPLAATGDEAGAVRAEAGAALPAGTVAARKATPPGSAAAVEESGPCSEEAETIPRAAAPRRAAAEKASPAEKPAAAGEPAVAEKASPPVKPAVAEKAGGAEKAGLAGKPEAAAKTEKPAAAGKAGVAKAAQSAKTDPAAKGPAEPKAAPQARGASGQKPAPGVKTAADAKAAPGKLGPGAKQAAAEPEMGGEAKGMQRGKRAAEASPAAKAAPAAEVRVASELKAAAGKRAEAAGKLAADVKVDVGVIVDVLADADALLAEADERARSRGADAGAAGPIVAGGATTITAGGAATVSAATSTSITSASSRPPADPGLETLGSLPAAARARAIPPATPTLPGVFGPASGSAAAQLFAPGGGASAEVPESLVEGPFEDDDVTWDDDRPTPITSPPAPLIARPEHAIVDEPTWEYPMGPPTLEYASAPVPVIGTPKLSDMLSAPPVVAAQATPAPYSPPPPPRGPSMGIVEELSWDAPGGLPSPEQAVADYLSELPPQVPQGDAPEPPKKHEITDELTWDVPTLPGKSK